MNLAPIADVSADHERPAPLLLNIPAAADMLGMSTRAVYRLIAAGAFPCPAALHKVGGRLKVSRIVLTRWASSDSAAA